MTSIIELLFKANHKEIDEAKDSLLDLHDHIPTVGEALEGLAKKFASIPGPIGLTVAAFAGFGMAVGEMVAQTVEAQVKLLELSEAVGIPIEKLQPFMMAMAASGVESDKLTASIGKLSGAVGSALENPTSKAANAFKQLGVSQELLKTGDTEAIMKAAAEGFNQYGDSIEKTAAARELFGRGGLKIVAAMKEEASIEEEAKKTLEDYGTAISETDAKASKHFEVTLKLGLSMFTGVANTITNSLVPGLSILSEQFTESGKAGGVMRDILDGAGATIIWLSKIIIMLLVEPIRFAAEAFKELGTLVGGTLAAIGAAMHGNFSEARDIIKGTDADLTKMQKDYVEGTAKFENALWDQKDGHKQAGEAADEHKEHMKALAETQDKVGDSLTNLIAKLGAQQDMFIASLSGLNAYKEAQDAIAIAQELNKLRTEHATEAQLKQAEAAMKATNAAKTATAEQVAGLNSVISLKSTLVGLNTKATESAKVEGEIQKQNLDVVNPALAAELRQTAQAIDQKKQDIEFQKIQVRLEADYATQKLHTVSTLKLTASEMKRVDDLQKLHANFVRDTEGKEGPALAKITAEYKKQEEAIRSLHAAQIAAQQSGQAFTDGLSKGLRQSQEEAMNLNQLGLSVATKMTDGLTNAFMNLANGGKDAFKQLLTGLLQMFEQQLIHFAVVEAELAVLAAFGISGPAAALLIGGPVTKSAKGNAFDGGGVVPLAKGGVVDGPTLAPMALMGEAGPEAILPLQRNAQGQLGVQVAGTGGPSKNGNTYHVDARQIHVHGVSDPHEAARQVQKQYNMANSIAKKAIIDERRPGGMLAQSSHAF